MNYPETESFLTELENKITVFIDEVNGFEERKKQYERTMQLTKYYNEKNTIGNVTGWNQIRFLCQGMPFLDFMKKYNLTPTCENPSEKEFIEFKNEYIKLYNEVFPKTAKTIKNFFVANKDKVTNIAIYRLQPAAVIPVHTNYDPHMYRCHMGIIVPKGDIGMLVEGEKRIWEVGKFFAFDSTRPHTVWNKTNQSRYVLSVDCYRHDIRYEDAKAVHNTLVKLRMEESKKTLGLSGGRSQLDQKIRSMYASEYEEI